MLTLTGVIRSASTLPPSVDKKTGEIRPARPVLQIEGQDHRGLIQLYTLTVPDVAPFADKTGQRVNVPVRAWASGGQVAFVYEPR